MKKITTPMKIAVLGAGRIGRVHIENIYSSVRDMQIKTVADPYLTQEGESFVKGLGIPVATKDVDSVFSDPEIDAVLICSSTDTHADQIIKAATAGKHIFCEKPVDHDVERVRKALAAVKEAGVKMQIGFVRRFDHNHRAVYDAVRDGKIGTPHILRISSRDPQPPTIEYVRRSGGLFYDMMIHDFDMIRFLADSEVTEVYAKGTVLVDPAIGAEGDVDTALVTLTFENGALGVIDNSRQAVYGYDQRLEVFGTKGSVQSANDIPNTAVVFGADDTSYGTTYKVMWDRYTQAFIDEMKAFADAVINDKVPPITDTDGLYPVLIAAAANKSIKEGRPVKISEVE
ncbi:inositol 2-dehydrogenase [Brenneria goodwinii]|uniref:inositol 2-dehydrogenase n=1 Tax=Brenneria goodwinii TaxID=1109412 RepID=UPI0036EE992D